jgi:glycosyltransferase involved in cell wall biosynthesis
MVRVSVCVTVFNEEQTVESLLVSLFHQTKRLSEIVVCDGGSTDRTVEILEKLKNLYRFRLEGRNDTRIRLFVSKGSVAHGRNVAIKKAKGEIIACIDAGCVAKRNWLEKLVEGFDSKGPSTSLRTSTSIVSGFYVMKWKTAFQKIMALYRGTPPERYDKNSFMPSCRSVAFRKSVWSDVGGFNEKLSLSGEDTQFFYRALKQGKTVVRMNEALVEWKEPEQFGFKDFKKFYFYAKGDAQTGIWWDPVKKWRTHNIKILTIYIRYLLILLPVVLSINYPLSIVSFFVFLCIYFLWSIWKWRDVVTKWHERVWIPVVQVGSDVMVMGGFLRGVWNLQLR